MNKIINKILYIVGTPIGNLQDISERAIHTLNNSDIILAEDTRHSLNLLRKFNITTPLKSYHKFNEVKRASELVALFEQYHTISLITDAGMPAISDPGYILVKAAHEHNILVRSVPGPSAVTSAISLSGIDCHKFIFEGFLDSKKSARLKELEKIKAHSYSTVLFEAPHRVLGLLEDMQDIFDDSKNIAIVKEITKQYEQVYYGKVGIIYDKFKSIDSGATIKGEYVVVIEGEQEKMNYKPDDMKIINALDILYKENITTKQASIIVSNLYKINKNYVYKLALKYNNEN